MTPSQSLVYGTAYNVSVASKDLAGTASWTFSTLLVGSILGVLVDGVDDPLAGILVHLSNGETATTDAQGNFAFEQVIVGNYALTVDMYGYESRST
jgi:hypothetical protein